MPNLQAVAVGVGLEGGAEGDGAAALGDGPGAGADGEDPPPEQDSAVATSAAISPVRTLRTFILPVPFPSRPLPVSIPLVRPNP
jgi:hypothetical protein